MSAIGGTSTPRRCRRTSGISSTPCGWRSGAIRLFERPHHRRVAHALQALDGPRLREWGCLFGGGTAIALRFGEYRESVDIDFLVSDLGVYRELRQVLTGIEGLA